MNIDLTDKEQEMLFNILSRIKYAHTNGNTTVNISLYASKNRVRFSHDNNYGGIAKSLLKKITEKNKEL